MESTQASSRVRIEAKTVSETSDINSILTRLTARDDFIAFSRRHIFRSYKTCCKRLDIIVSVYSKSLEIIL